MNSSQLKIVSFNIWDLPYWFVKNRKQRILQIAAYLQRLDAEIVCLQESFDVYHRKLLYESLGSDKYYASGGFETTRKAPLASFDTTGGLVIFSKFPIIQDKFVPFKQFGSSPSLRPSAKARHTRPKCAFAYCVHFATRTPSFGSA
jgi:hypothetical protein